jgi:hypothetical protein
MFERRAVDSEGDTGCGKSLDPEDVYLDPVPFTRERDDRTQPAFDEMGVGRLGTRSDKDFAEPEIDGLKMRRQPREVGSGHSAQ